MKRASPPLLACLLSVSGAFAAEQDFSSPYDTNPRCTERTYDGNAPECVIQDEGSPRQLYPPGRKPPITNVPPQNPPTAGTPPSTPPPTESSGQQSGTAQAQQGSAPAQSGAATATPGTATSSAGAAAPSATAGSARREGAAAGRSSR